MGTFAQPPRHSGIRGDLIGNGIEGDAFFGSPGRIVEVGIGAIAKQRPDRHVCVGGRIPERITGSAAGSLEGLFDLAKHVGHVRPEPLRPRGGPLLVRLSLCKFGETLPRGCVLDVAAVLGYAIDDGLVLRRPPRPHQPQAPRQVPFHRPRLTDHIAPGRHEDRRAIQIHPEIAVILGLEEFGRRERRRVDLVSGIVVLLVPEREEDAAGLGGTSDIEVFQLKLVGGRRARRAAYCRERESGRERAGEDESRGDALHGEEIVMCCVD